jgi:hypothetical protein
MTCGTLVLRSSVIRVLLNFLKLTYSIIVWLRLDGLNKCSDKYYFKIMTLDGYKWYDHVEKSRVLYIKSQITTNSITSFTFFIVTQSLVKKTKNDY